MTETGGWISTWGTARRFFLQRRNGRAVHQVDIQPPVSVIVDQRDSGNHCFYLILVCSRGVLSREAQACFGSSVLEPDGPRIARCLCRGIRFDQRRSQRDLGDQTDGEYHV